MSTQLTPGLTEIQGNLVITNTVNLKGSDIGGLFKDLTRIVGAVTISGNKNESFSLNGTYHPTFGDGFPVLVLELELELELVANHQMIAPFFLPYEYHPFFGGVLMHFCTLTDTRLCLLVYAYRVSLHA